jgi:hypothetical protein
MTGVGPARSTAIVLLAVAACRSSQGPRDGAADGRVAAVLAAASVAAVARTVPAMFDRAGCASYVRIDFPDWWVRCAVAHVSVASCVDDAGGKSSVRCDMGGPWHR